MSGRFVQGRGLVLILGQGRDGLGPLVRAKTGPMSEPGSKLGVWRETGLKLSLGQDRQWVGD